MLIGSRGLWGWVVFWGLSKDFILVLWYSARWIPLFALMLCSFNVLNILFNDLCILRHLFLTSKYLLSKFSPSYHHFRLSPASRPLRRGRCASLWRNTLATGMASGMSVWREHNLWSWGPHLLVSAKLTPTLVMHSAQQLVHMTDLWV